jgi:hypothetical protein
MAFFKNDGLSSGIPSVSTIKGTIDAVATQVKERYPSKEEHQQDLKLMYLELFTLIEEQRVKITKLEERIKDLEERK